MGSVISHDEARQLEPFQSHPTKNPDRHTRGWPCWGCHRRRCHEIGSTGDQTRRGTVSGRLRVVGVVGIQRLGHAGGAAVVVRVAVVTVCGGVGEPRVVDLEARMFPAVRGHVAQVDHVERVRTQQVVKVALPKFLHGGTRVGPHNIKVRGQHEVGAA